jgi:hypothetical protein
MIDILPRNQKKIIKKIRLLRMINTFIWIGIILVFIGVVLFLPTLITINSRYDIAEVQMKKLEESGAIIKAVDIASLETRTRLLLTKLGATLSVSPVDYIAFVKNMTPTTITLKGFNMGSSNAVPTLDVSGISKTRQDLQQFVDTIKANPKVALVDSPVSNFVKSTDNEFKITITFKK